MNDLTKELASDRAQRTFRTLNKQNLFALAFRTNAMKTPAGRAKKIATLVTTLAAARRSCPTAPRARVRNALLQEHERGDCMRGYRCK
jgi:Bacteriocin-protection, YdeI or OmpD-Associated